MRNPASLKNYRLVVLDCPYDVFQLPTAQKYFSRYVALKLGGYTSEYARGALPLGSYDFIGTLYLLLHRSTTGWRPAMCVKATSQERCAEFRLPFEMYGLFSSPEHAQHLRQVQSLVERASSCGEAVGYFSSWTIAPRYRSDSSVKAVLRDLFLALLVLHFQTEALSEVVVGAAQRFKVDQWISRIGFDYLSDSGKPLPPISCPFLNGEKTVLMRLQCLSDRAHELAYEFADVWGRRRLIQASPNKPAPKNVLYETVLGTAPS